jgi:hypothetical protein
MRKIVHIVFTFVAIAVIFSFLVISQQVDLAHFSSSYFDDMVNRKFAGKGSKVFSSFVFGFNNQSQYLDDPNKQGIFSVVANSYCSYEGNDSGIQHRQFFLTRTKQSALIMLPALLITWQMSR